MSYRHARTNTIYLALVVAVPLLGACDSSPADPDPGATQTASATVTPVNATVAQGATVGVTVVFSATGGLTIGSSFTINKPLPGISVTQDSSQTSGSTITQVYTIGADTTVAAGTYDIRFSTPVMGYTGSGAVPTASVTFPLAVTQ